MKCKSLKKDGSRCKGNAIEDGYCFAHIPKGETSNLVKVRAIKAFHDGMIPNALNWKAEEVREVDKTTFKQLQECLPGNWMIE